MDDEGVDGGYNRSLFQWRYEIERVMRHKKAMGRLAEWIPHNIRSSVVKVGLSGNEDLGPSGTMIANTTAIRGVFKNIHDAFSQLFQQKKGLHSFTQNGMEEKDFLEADRNITDLMNELQDKQDLVWDMDDDDEDEDDEDDEDDFYDDEDDEDDESDEDF